MISSVIRESDEGRRMGSDIKPIETRYKGYRFRSRLEARWAVFFDNMGLRWRYEVEGFDLGERGWYLPDFYLPDWGCFVEIKPDIPDDNTVMKMARLANNLHDGGNRLLQHMILCGTPGLPSIDICPNGADANLTTGDGYVCLTVTAATEDLGVVPIECFAMVNGGKDLDVWPIYLECGGQKSGDEDCELENPMVTFPVTVNNVRRTGKYLGLVLPFGPILRMYKGAGVIYRAPKLLYAYTAARSARFEHGETPA